ncbi:MAG: STAS domain-containing protein [Euryarchaeota archaeon]|nr:STAS domain-containing protein [Euryarchaeota archaeon]
MAAKIAKVKIKSIEEPETAAWLVADFTSNGDELQQMWTKEMKAEKLLDDQTPKEIRSESELMFNTYLECLRSGNYSAVVEYSKKLGEKTVFKLVGIMVYRRVLSRHIVIMSQGDIESATRSLLFFERIADHILALMTNATIEVREKLALKQAESILELSTPVLSIRDRLLVLPIIGILDSLRARQLTENLLHGVRENRARVVVIDITGVALVDSAVANHLILTIDAARLMGATVILTGISPEIARTMVALGVDLSKFNAMGDIRSGIEEAERILGYKLVLSKDEDEP